METIGQILISSREKKKLSVQDVHESTRITPENLIALEENRFDFFPNKVYARAFLRDYANFLGLDSGELLDRYELELGNGFESPSSQKKVYPKKRSLKWVFAIILFLAILAAGGYYAWDEYGTQITQRFQTKPSEVIEPETQQPVLEPVEETIPATEPLKPAEPNIIPTKPTVPVESTQPPVTASGLKLRVATLAEVWVRVNADGKNIFVGILPNAKVQEFSAKEKIEIRVGKPAAVQFRLNDTPKPSLGDPKQAATTVFTLADLVKN